MLKSDPQDLQDIESPQLRNITLDSGVVGPRFGTTLLLAKPSGETGAPSQLLKAKDSNGTVYEIAVYGQNFYLRDPVYNVWIKISPTVLPTQSGFFYGSAAWNLGTGSDAFYFGNGVDVVMKWAPLLTYLAKATNSSDTQITVPDSTLFPYGVISLPILIGSTPVTLTNNATGASIEQSTNPENQATLTLTINGTAIIITFVDSIGSNPGNVLIGATATATMTNLLGLLQSPGTTNSTQVAFSSGDQTLIGLFTFVALSDAMSFSMTPNSSVSSLVVNGLNSTTYTNPNNILTVRGTVGAVIAIDTAITNQIQTVATVPRGNRFIVGVAQGGFYRLFVSGAPGDENILYYSQGYNPLNGGTPWELFPTPRGPATGSGTLVSGWYPIIDGEGGIEDLVDFGQYLGIVKANAVVQFYFTIDTTDDTIGPNTNPTIYGESIFPVGAHTFPASAVNITVENALYIVTSTQGIFQYIPSSTGAQLSTTITPFSDNILSLFSAQIISFAKGRTEFFNRQLIYLCSSIPGVNDLVLIYDFVFNAWVLWDNLNAVDVKEVDGDLHFLCNDDGGLYFYDNTSYQDARSGQAVGYTTELYSKRFDWQQPANPKQQSMAMLQGYITANTTLFVDVLFNENGNLALTTYQISGEGVYVQQIPVYTPGRISLGQNPIGGAQMGTIGVFRVYLDLLKSIGAHVVQFRLYSVNPGDQWGITGLSVNPEINEQIPTEYVLGI